jgi:hypothetical protein
MPILSFTKQQKSGSLEKTEYFRGSATDAKMTHIDFDLL